MIHTIERVPNDGFHDSGEILFRSPSKNDLLLLSLGLILFAPVCFYRGVPHDNAAIFAVVSFLVGLLVLVWSRIACEVVFRKRAQVAEVKWLGFGINLATHSFRYAALQISVRIVYGSGSGPRGGGSPVPRAWLSLRAGNSVFLFDRPLGVAVSEKDIPLLAYELGMPVAARDDMADTISPSRDDSL